jgi:hypothetical protein
MALNFFEHTVIGTSRDFMRIRHLVLRGSQYEIGARLAQVGLSEHGIRKAPAAEPAKVRAQRLYMQKNFPLHYERMRGAASALGVDLENDHIDCSYLNYAPRLPACSTVYYPPAFTANGHATLSRNFDFTTGTFMATEPAPGEPPAVSRPYIVEVYPDEGYPSLYLAAFDLLAGCTDGINAAGLMVALNADSESTAGFPLQPTFGSAVGVSEIQLPRLLLDTCATVDEARDLLLQTKHFYMCAPCHYLIADRSGRSFVWEFSPTRNTEYIIDGQGRPQILTNHLLHRHDSTDDLPCENFTAGTFARYRTLSDSLKNMDAPLTREQMTTIHAAVAITDESYPQPQSVPDRTLWHAIYDSKTLSVDVDFYLGDEILSTEPLKRKPRRSGYFHFALQTT